MGRHRPYALLGLVALAFTPALGLRGVLSRVRSSVAASAEPGILAGASASALGLWSAYTIATRQRLMRTFLELQLVSACAHKANAAPDIAQRLGRWGSPRARREPTETILGDWQVLLGTDDAPVDDAPRDWTYESESLRFWHQDGSDLLVQGRPTLETLGDLLGRRWASRVVESTASRLAWATVLAAAPGVKPGEESDIAAGLGGDWRFVYRSHVDGEELFGMLTARFTIHGLALRSRDVTKLTVDVAAGTATLTDSFILLSGLPFTIKWFGSLRTAQGRCWIEWTRTEARVGWWRFGHTVANPPAAEARRAEPWEVHGFASARMDGEDREVVFLERVDYGTLAFSRCA